MRVRDGASARKGSAWTEPAQRALSTGLVGWAGVRVEISHAARSI